MAQDGVTDESVIAEKCPSSSVAPSADILLYLPLLSFTGDYSIFRDCSCISRVTLIFFALYSPNDQVLCLLPYCSYPLFQIISFTCILLSSSSSLLLQAILPLSQLLRITFLSPTKPKALTYQASSAITITERI